MLLSEKIQTLRKKEGLSQEQLAEKLGVSRQAVSKWESAQSIPEIDKITQMSTLFGVTTDYLLRNEENTSEPLSEDTEVYKTSDPKQKHKRVVPQKIVCPVTIIIVVIAAIGIFASLISNHKVFFSSDDRMEYYFDMAVQGPDFQKEAVGFFNKKYAGTSNESTGITFLKEAINNDDLSLVSSDFYEMLLSLKTDNEEVAALSKGLEILSTATSITSIYANPDTYAEKEVFIVGFFSENDLKRKVVRLTLGDGNASIECYYGSGEVFSTGMNWENYSETSYYYEPIALAYGYMRQYNNSEDVYMIPYQYVAPAYNGVSNCEVLSTISGWDVVPISEQETHPILKNTIPTYFPQDVLPLYRLYNVVSSSNKDDSIGLSYQSNANFDELFNYYNDLLIDLSGQYILQKLGSNMKGLTALLPDTDKCVYVIVSDGASIDGTESEKATAALVILGSNAYYETKGTLVKSK